MPVAFCASNAHAAIMCSDDFEGAGNCGAWTNQGPGPSSEWSVDSSTDPGNTSHKRVDGSGTTGAWNDQTVSNTYGDVTVMAMVRIDSFNGTGSDQAAIFGRWETNAGLLNWYSVAITSDGWMHIRRMYNGTVSNLLDVNNIAVTEGEWFRLRLELKGTNPVWVSAYLDNVFEGAVHDNTQTAIGQGQAGFGSFGVTAHFDDFVVGDANDAIGKDSNGNPIDCFTYPGVCQESGESAIWLGGQHARSEMWAMNNVPSLPWAPVAKRGL